MPIDELLGALRDRGLTVAADGDALLVQPRSLLTDELRAAIRANKPALLAEVSAQAHDVVRHDYERTGDSERRRAEVLARLAADPTLRRAFVLERGDPMILGVAIRGIAYGELEIPAARCDPRCLLTLLDEHDQPQTVH